MTTHELKLLLALNGNKRIPELEKEIFASEKETHYYLKQLSAQRIDDHFGHSLDIPPLTYDDNGWAIFYYASDVIGADG